MNTDKRINADHISEEYDGQKSRVEDMKHPLFSVAMCVYGGDNPEWFDRALQSITVEQTVKPDEIVVVVDGPVPKGIRDVIDKYTEIFGGGGSLNAIYLKENKGLGNALRVAVKNCTHKIIARMDSDDISVADRFEQQLSAMMYDDSIDIIGGDITEFIGKEDNIKAVRKVPVTDMDIRKYMRTRCPLNHVTVMYKKKAVQTAGGYLDWHYDEDYYLWIRMMECGAVFANTGTVLVNVRVGEDMYQRRGGLKYFKSEAKLQKYMLDHKLIPISTYISNWTKRFVLQVLMPNSLRAWVYKRFARS